MLRYRDRSITRRLTAVTVDYRKLCAFKLTETKHDFEIFVFVVNALLVKLRLLCEGN